MRHIVVWLGLMPGVILGAADAPQARPRTDDPVVQRVLKHEGGLQDRPVRVVGKRDLPPDLWRRVKGLVAFRIHRHRADGTTTVDPVIYLTEGSAMYVKASTLLNSGSHAREHVWCLLAAVLAHEAAHTAPATERQALVAEAAQLRRCISAGHLHARDDWSPLAYVGRVEARLRNPREHY